MLQGKQELRYPVSEIVDTQHFASPADGYSAIRFQVLMQRRKVFRL